MRPVRRSKRCAAILLSESTFGLPIYRWAPQRQIFDDIDTWWRTNADEGRASLLFGYAFGKAQRLLAGVDTGIGPVVCHGAVEKVNEAYRASGISLPKTQSAGDIAVAATRHALIIAPPSAQATPWLKRLGPYSDAFASGWMQLRGARRRRGVDRGFVLSDHADWPGLLQAIAATGAQRVIATHGYSAVLVGELDATTSTRDKLAALGRYYSHAPAQDAAWATYFLAGGKPRQVVPSRLLREIALRASGLDDWLLEECYLAVGDFAETVALILPPPTRDDDSGLAEWVGQRLSPLRGAAPAVIEERLRGYWNMLGTAERFLLGKLIGGAFRVGVSRLLVQRALAKHSGIDAKTIAQRMMGYTDGTVAPTAQRFASLIDAADSRRPSGQPYPFFLAHQLGEAPAALGDINNWMVEWKYDGIRSQVVRHDDAVWVWSRGEDLITDRFPEIAAAGLGLPVGTVMDGEILAWQDERPRPFALLQKRIGRKALTRKILTQVPVTLVAYDLLEDAVDAIIRRTTIEKFGPVRSVTPTMVFELGFEGIQRSGRHKSGIAVRFPRMLRWRTDKTIDEAGTLTDLNELLPQLEDVEHAI